VVSGGFILDVVDFLLFYEIEKVHVFNAEMLIFIFIKFV